MATGVLFNDTENQMLEWEFSGGAFAQPTNLFFEASTTTPAEDGTNITLPVGNNYSGVIHNAWNAAVGRASTNNGDITFPTPSGPWGNITHIVCKRDNTGGQPLFYFDMNPAETIDAANPLVLVDGDIIINFVASTWSDYLANAWFDHLLKNTARVPGTTHYAEWSSTAYNDDGTGGTPPAELNRALIGSWNPAVNGTIDNVATFQTSAATGDTPSLTHVAVYDAVTAGNMLVRQTVDTAKIVLSGQTARYNASQYNISVD